MKIKRFSLEEGGFTGKKFGAGQTYFRQGLVATGLGAGIGAAIGQGRGALIGSGIGLITGLITAALTRSCFNRKPQENITTKNLLKEWNRIDDAVKELGLNGEMWDIDEDPGRFDISVKANEDTLVMYIRPLKREEINAVNKVLDYWCENAKNNDYVSEQTKDGGWIVTMKLVNYTSAAGLLFELMTDCRFRINFLVRK